MIDLPVIPNPAPFFFRFFRLEMCRQLRRVNREQYCSPLIIVSRAMSGISRQADVDRDNLRG
jgi:hypothetical protein